jgi:hypothetical protein
LVRAASHLAPGTWHLAPGTWHLGTWHLGTWHLGTSAPPIAASWPPAHFPDSNVREYIASTILLKRAAAPAAQASIFVAAAHLISSEIAR